MILEALMPRAATPAPDDDFWYTDSPRRTGQPDVSPNGALQVTAVLACVRVQAETIAQLPLHLMATDGRMRRQAVEHPLYDVLHDQPNDWQTSFEFREMMQGHVALRGNCYALIVPGPRGAVDQLIPLHPDRMEVYRLENKRIGYVYRDKQGIPYRLTQDEVFHLRFMSLDDCVGMSVIAACRNAVELAQQLDHHGIRFYRNAARPSGVIKMPESFHFKDEDHAKRLGKSWRDAHTGEDLFTVAFLEGGAEWQQLGLSNEDAQWLESKRKSVTEIAMMFRVPPHMIGSAIEHGHTYANVEQSDLAFMKHTALPWVCRWEGAIKRDLIVQPQDPVERFYAKFGMEGLLRADTKTRVYYFKEMKAMGALSVNEIRALDDRNPIDGGDEYNTASPPALPPPGNQDGGNGGALVAEHNKTRKCMTDGFSVGTQERTQIHNETMVSVSASTADMKTVAEEQGEQTRECIVAARSSRSEESKQYHDEQMVAISAEAADTRSKAEAIGNNTIGRVDINGEQNGKDHSELMEIVQTIHNEMRPASWLADAAERIAGVEIEALESRADKAAADREKFDAWVKQHWNGKVRKYCERTLSPMRRAGLLPTSISERNLITLAASVCDTAVAQLTAGDPVEVLERWKTGRANEITKLLTGDLNDDG